MERVFKNDEFQFGVELALGATYRQAADVGEVLSTAERIGDGDSDAWVREWIATAHRCQQAARIAAGSSHDVSALAFYRRAATYYATALYRMGAGAPRDSELEVWRRQRECWEQIVDRQPSPGERILISYEDTTLPGYFFRAPDARPSEPRPLIIMNNGSDGATSQMWLEGGAAASERGYHWMTFDGPGQQAAFYEQHIPFRHDWEAVLTPVLDALLARPDVDRSRVAVIGVSQAGYWLPRALSFEHRPAAAVVDPGVWDVSASWMRPLPRVMREQLRDGKRSAFDREMRVVETLSPETAATLDFRARPYGIDGDSRFDLYTAVCAYRLDGEEQQITTPLLITNPEDEQFWPGQARELHDRLPGPRTLVSFTAHEGAGRHCEPTARALREARIFDWLEDQLR